MPDLEVLELRPPFLVMIGDVHHPLYAKTGLGLVHWRRDRVAGQLRFAGCKVDLGVPDMTVAEAKRSGVGSLVIGVAAVGGIIPDSWLAVLEEAAAAGIDIVSGLHLRLGTFESVAAAARQSGARLVDVRVPPAGLPVGNGKKRRGRRLLMAGTDCAVGKKYSALTLAREMQAAGMKATFRATGQTGIMIAGSGIPIDAVVADFVSGAAELLSPDNDDDHWDVIEGQGSLFHPGYAAVSLGLLHGSQPDAIVVCHEAGRTEMDEWPGYRLPTVADCVERNLLEGRLTNPGVRCVGVSVNTSGLPAGDRDGWLAALARETGFPCVDPIAGGMQPVLERIAQDFSSGG